MNSPITSLKRALVYTRVSTEEQAGDDRQSLKAQKRICQKALEDMGFTLAENGIYSDPGRSGTNMNRPGLQEALIRIQEDKRISALFVQDTDRLARNVTDHLAMRALLRKHEVELVSVSQPGIKDDAEGRVLDIVIAGFSQFQSDITSRKTIKSLEEKFHGGWWPTKAPLGYINAVDPSNQKQRIILTDKARAPLIAEMFKLYATGDYSAAEVRDVAHRKGLTTVAGKRLALSKMFELLRCRFYYGDMHWRGLEKKGNHEPIITRETFDRCKSIMEFNNRYACRRRKYDFLLRGFVFCATCGQRHTAAHVFKKHKSYYYCNRAGDRKKCTEKYVELADLENQVQQRFYSIKFSPALVGKIESKVRQLYEKQKEAVAIEKRALLTRKANIEKKLEVAEEKLLSNIFSDSAYARVKNRVEEELGPIEDALYELDRKKNLKMDVIREVLKIARNIGDAYREAPPKLKRLYLGLFWEEFRVAGKAIVEARKTPILVALEAAGSVSFAKAIKSPLRAFATASEKSVQISSVRGGYRESNPDRELHKLQC